MNHPVKEIPKSEISPAEQGLDLQMQADLVRRADEAGVSPEEWVSKYAENYRKIITENPSLLESYGENEEETLKLVEEKLLEKAELNKGV